MLLLESIAAAFAVAILIVRTAGRTVARKSRWIAVVCCGLVVPACLLVAGVALEVTERLRADPTYTDTISKGGIYVVLGLLAVPFTMLTSALALPSASSRQGE